MSDIIATGRLSMKSFVRSDSDNEQDRDMITVNPTKCIVEKAPTVSAV